MNLFTKARLWLRVSAFCVFFYAFAEARQSHFDSIQDTIDNQARAWNSGDLEKFVETYSDDAVFVGKPVLHSRKALLTRYKSRYPNRAAMGTLTLRILESRQLDSNVATAIGEWHLTQSQAGGGDVGGLFSVVLQKGADGWQIVLDHTQ
jgi:uncharacterized protein (TIGR02246 family)